MKGNSMSQSVTVRMPKDVHEGYHTLKIKKMKETGNEVSKNDLYVKALTEYLEKHGDQRIDI